VLRSSGLVLEQDHRAFLPAYSVLTPAFHRRPPAIFTRVSKKSDAIATIHHPIPVCGSGRHTRADHSRVKVAMERGTSMASRPASRRSRAHRPSPAADQRSLSCSVPRRSRLERATFHQSAHIDMQHLQPVPLRVFHQRSRRTVESPSAGLFPERAVNREMPLTISLA